MPAIFLLSFTRSRCSTKAGTRGDYGSSCCSTCTDSAARAARVVRWAPIYVLVVAFVRVSLCSTDLVEYALISAFLFVFTLSRLCARPLMCLPFRLGLVSMCSLTRCVSL